MKTCSNCKETKDFSAFGKHASNKDGYQYQCKACRKIGCAKYFKSLTAEKTQKRLECTKNWREKNKDHVVQYGKQYAKANQAKRTALQRKRDIAKTQQTPKWLSNEQLKEIEQFYAMAKELESVFPWKQHVDHIVPLKGKTVSGLHVPWNLQILSAKANIQKGNKHYG